MKNILITGANSYIGVSVQRYLENYSDDYNVKTVGTKNGEWEEVSFSSFDVVYHVAGIAHSDVGKVSEELKSKYYAINTDLTISIAKKAKAEGVNQFIFMSSSIVYGDSAPIGKEKIISKDTPYNPANYYGDSKVHAEKGLLNLSDNSFKIVILRCPMIYGKSSRGNFPILERMALKLPIFPNINNKRSMLYIKNLAEFVRLMIDNNEQGIFWPCNREYSNTSELVMMIAEYHNKKVILIPYCQWILKFGSYLTRYVNKAFGNLAYAPDLGDYKYDYRLYTLKQSIEEIEA
ncbi:NAD-dependent epimerase/dehydratase family protein [Ileibacterium valens]|uniref:NAD-dependent epimerase/dehydratase family protein n=1 Tax=Ileibacterium valens TaxID=1862668 RepID=UPI00272D1CC3|nr:NAD-dependent epimerase/dehydratase family protein [Ileibacterium valens]